MRAEEQSMRSLIVLAGIIALGGCSSVNPCDLMTIDATFVNLTEHGYLCSATDPCVGEVDVTMQYEDATLEPKQTVVIPVSVGDERTLTATTSVYEGLIGEKDSFPVREVVLWLDVPGSGRLEYDPITIQESDVTLLDTPQEYEACNVEDEEKMVQTFDAANAQILSVSDTDAP
jgi:hypothetical protein